MRTQTPPTKDRWNKSPALYCDRCDKRGHLAQSCPAYEIRQPTRAHKSELTRRRAERKWKSLTSTPRTVVIEVRS